MIEGDTKEQGIIRLCNCNSGRYICSITKDQIQFIWDAITFRIRSAKVAEEIDSTNALSILDIVAAIQIEIKDSDDDR